MKEDNITFKRAFTITTKNATYGEDKYVVIATTFAEAEELYWTKLNGYYEILSIEVIPDIKGTASFKEE